MKIWTKSRWLIAIIVILAVSCTDDIDNPLPDLNPGTPEGGEITIYPIDDFIYFDDSEYGSVPQLDEVSRTYDINENGAIDLSLISRRVNSSFLSHEFNVELRFIGQILRTNYSPDIPFLNLEDTPVYLPVDGLVGGTAEGRWTSETTPLLFIKDFPVEVVTLWTLSFSFPVGLSYIPTRTNIGGEWYYGWIEILASDYEDDDPADFVYISRFGISQTPGLRVRMGKE